MVGKLIKYEFKAFSKLMLPIEIVLIGVAALYRIMMFFENGTSFFSIFNISTIVIFVISIITAIIMTTIMSIVRFYKNLFTNEGYLSFTLPVTTSAHIASKLIVSLIYDLITVITIIVSLSVAMAGDVLVEVSKAAAYLFGEVTSSIGSDSLIYILEFAVLFVIALAATHLLFYACISVGQLANKHKVLLAVGVYFGYYIFCQLVSTLVIALLTTSGKYYEIVEFISENPKTSAHLILCGAILLYLVLGVIYYSVSHAIIKKKLNLE